MKFLGAIVAVIIVLAVIVAAVSPNGFFGLSEAPKEKSVLQIGVILPLTGANAVYGEGAKEGLELAKNEINSQSNAPYLVEYVYEDTSSDLKNAAASAQKLISVDKVPVIISVVSNTSLTVAPIAQKNKVVLFTVASQTNKLNDAGDYVFKSDDDLSKLGVALADMAFKEGKRKAAILYSISNDACTEAQKAFVQRFEGFGGQVVDVEGTGKEDKGYYTQLSKIKSANPDLIVLALLQNENIIALNELKELKITTELLSIGTIEDEAVVKGAPLSEGIVFMTFQAMPTASFLEKTNSAYSHYPKRWSMEAYDVAHIIAQAASTINSKDLSSIELQKELSLIRSYDGEVGQIVFDVNGNAQRPIYTKQIINRKFVLYQAN
jgi:branched-chain amino acid transport system substrate-binding protein